MLNTKYIYSFERELKSKLSLKSSGYTTEETVLLNAFKYFDLDNSGNCTKNEFIRTINKIGITGFDEEALAQLFQLYDTDNTGELSYKEFVGILFKNNSIINEKRTNPAQVYQDDEKPRTKQEELNQDNVQNVLTRIREKLASRGVRGICAIAKNFAIIDDNCSNTIDFNEFKKACKDFRFGLSEKEYEIAFNAFDRDNTGEIDYDEFLRTIRGEMNDFRRGLVEQAFNILDKDKSGIIEIEDLKGVYNATYHPDVQSGKKDEEEVFLEFLETFESSHSYLNGNQCDGKVSLDEFIEYYENVSMSIDDDAYFEVMMNNCWRMGENTTYNNEKKGWSNKDEENKESKGSLQKNYNKTFNKKAQKLRSKPKMKEEEIIPNEERDEERNVEKEEENLPKEESPLLIQFRKVLKKRGENCIIGLAKQFKIIDDNNSKTLDKSEFKKAINDFGLRLTQQEIEELFDEIDIDNSGLIDYNEFLRAIRGEMNETRKQVVCKAFNKMDYDHSGIIDLDDIKRLFSAKTHKDVISGERTEEEIYGEFLSSFKMHHDNKRGFRDSKVTKEEFLEYYDYVSMNIDDDEYFVQMIETCWRLNSYTPIAKKAWVGEIGFGAYSTEGDQTLPAGKKIGQRMKGRGTIEDAPYGTNPEPINYTTSNNPQGIKKAPFSSKGDIILLKFREEIVSRGVRGIMSIRRAFAIADDNNSKTLDYQEFDKFCHDYRIGLTPEEVERLFKMFDINNNGTIDYEEFIRNIVGEMNDFRVSIVKKVFDKLDKNGNGVIETDDIKNVYSTEYHPDVISGKKTEGEVLSEFLDTFEYHFGLFNNKKTKDSKITLEEFLEYYNYISMSIDNDNYFEVMMTNAWNLEEKPNYAKGWSSETKKSFNFGKGGWKRELTDKITKKPAGEN